MRPTRKPMKLPLASMLISLLALTACATMTGSGEIDVNAVYCRNYEPVTWSVNDTTDSIIQNKRNNARWVALCRGRQ